MEDLGPQSDAGLERNSGSFCRGVGRRRAMCIIEPEVKDRKLTKKERCSEGRDSNRGGILSRSA